VSVQRQDSDGNLYPSLPDEHLLKEKLVKKGNSKRSQRLLKINLRKLKNSYVHPYLRAKVLLV